MFDLSFMEMQLAAKDARIRAHREMIHRQQEQLNALRENPQAYLDAEIARLEHKLTEYQRALENI